MYKKVSLEKFERHKYCVIPEWQFESIKEEFEFHVKVLNEGIQEGYDLLDSYLRTYDNQLVGIRRVCSMVGIDFEVNYEK